MGPYTVVLADDHPMFRDGVRKIIERIENVQVGGEAGDGLELLEILKKSCPHLVILDISMPNLRGLEAIKEIKRTYPQVKVLVLTMHKKREFIRQALTFGADGFLVKEDAGGELIRAINTIRKGGKYLSPLLASVLTTMALEEEKADILTIREREVLKLLAEGKKTLEIAEALYISPNTVRRHRSNIMEKLNIKSMADLLKYAISRDYIVEHS
ncbi:MAG: response regulator transcription factor [Deltaproteobacteria bacterium]|nr:response regulator transcription factor [Deltaproteobacteria bacterium]